MKRTIKIIITQNYKLKCFIVDEQGKEIFISIKDNQVEEVTPSILFENNFIYCCPQQKSENIIYFIQQWIENP